jgi:hypothetical protein
MDDYDNFLLGDVNVAYSPRQQPLSELDTQRLRMSTYEIVTTQIPAAGQLGVTQPGPCTVKLEVELSDLEFPQKGSRRTAPPRSRCCSVIRSPEIRWCAMRSTASWRSGARGGWAGSPRLQSTLEIVAVDMREHFRYALPLKGTGGRADRGCKGVIGAVRKKAREAHPQ